MDCFQFLLEKDEDFDVAEMKEMDLKEMDALNEKTKQVSERQAKTNLPYRERLLTLCQEADARGFFDKYA